MSAVVPTHWEESTPVSATRRRGFFTPSPHREGGVGGERAKARFHESRAAVLVRLVQFLAVGLTGLAVDLGVLTLLLGVLPLAAARAAAIGVAMTWNFWLNRRFTFSYARTRPLLPQYLFFCLSCSVGAVVNWSASLALASVFTAFAVRPLLAAGAGTVVGCVSNFLLCNNAVFPRAAESHPALASR